MDEVCTPERNRSLARTQELGGWADSYKLVNLPVPGRVLMHRAASMNNLLSYRIQNNLRRIMQR